MLSPAKEVILYWKEFRALQEIHCQLTVRWSCGLRVCGRPFICRMSLGSIDSHASGLSKAVFSFHFLVDFQILGFCSLSRCASSIIFSEVSTEVVPHLLSGVVAVLHKLIISGSPEVTHRTAVNRYIALWYLWFNQWRVGLNLLESVRWNLRSHLDSAFYNFVCWSSFSSHVTSCRIQPIF